MSFSDALRNEVRRMIDEAAQLRQLTVAAVGLDGTVDLSYGDGGRIESVPCAGTYAPRTVGDKVWVIHSQAGNWEVLCKSEV